MARRTSDQVRADNVLIDQIRQSIETNPKTVVRAITLLASFQTAGEKEMKASAVDNGQGFSQVDANYGTFLAEVAAREGRLHGKFLNDARRIALKYHRTQLFEAAKAKRDAEPS